MAERRASAPPSPASRDSTATGSGSRSRTPVSTASITEPTTGSMGDLFGGRYRLAQLVHKGRTELWRAEDEVLARSVALRLLHPDTSPALKAEFLSAAAQAGRYAGPGVARIFDAATEQVNGANQRLCDVTFVVAAWVEGPTLAQTLAEGPWDVGAAVDLVTALCATLEMAHASGVFARRLHPGHVLLPAMGEPVIVDLEISALLHEESPAAASHTDLVRLDTQDLARVLYAAVTGCWPASARGTAWSGLPPAPEREGRLCLPRQVRAGLPRTLDLVTAQTLEPQRRPNDRPISTPRELGTALASLTSAEVDAKKPVEEAPVVRQPRRRLWLVLPALVALVAIGVVAFLLGLVVGRVPGPTTTAPKVPGLHANPSAGAAVPQPLTLDSVNSFDPPPGDGLENEDLVPNATDGNPATAWTTEQYTSRDFGGIKKTGVGLLVDLGSAKAVTRVVLTAPAGQTIEILAAPGATSPPTRVSAGSTPLVSNPVMTSSHGDTTIAVTPGTVSEWYVVWITGLAPDPAAHAFVGTIQEMAFYG